MSAILLSRDNERNLVRRLSRSRTGWEANREEDFILLDQFGDEGQRLSDCSMDFKEVNRQSSLPIPSTDPPLTNPPNTAADFQVPHIHVYL